MTELTPFLKQLLSLPGLSGHEGPVRDAIAQVWQPLVDELSTSRLGSLHGLRRGSGPEPRPRILLSAHMDSIGLMVTGIVDGFLRFTQVVGVDPRILPGQLVTVHGVEDLPAIVVQPADRLLPPAAREKPVAMEHLLVETGLLPDDVARMVKVGDLISFAQPPQELTGDTITGHTLDNRASVAAVTLCLQELQRMTHSWDVYAVATVQEENILGGGYTSPFEIRPQIGVALDVEFARGPGVSDYHGFFMGKGPVLAFGPNIHPALHKRFKELADKLDIPTQVEVMPRHSGTDAFAMQVVAEGIPSMVIYIPLRYMHTPVEVVSLKDIQRAGHLLAEFIARLEPDYALKIKWEENNP